MTERTPAPLVRHPHAPLVLLGVLMVATLGLLAVEAVRLPETIATHFNGAGQADGWMTLTTHLVTSAIFGVVFPLFPAGLMAACLRLPGKFINLPHRDYWLAPERRAETNRWMLRHMFWMSCVLASAHLTIQGMVMAANLESPPRMAGATVFGLTGGLLAATATWLMVLWRRFGRLPNQ